MQIGKRGKGRGSLQIRIVPLPELLVRRSLIRPEELALITRDILTRDSLERRAAPDPHRQGAIYLEHGEVEALVVPDDDAWRRTAGGGAVPDAGPAAMIVGRKEVARAIGMTYHHTNANSSSPMPKSKIAVSLERSTVQRIDRLVREGVFANRSRAIEAAVEEKLAGLDRTRLVRECAKLDPAFERALADEGMSENLGGWPEY